MRPRPPRPPRAPTWPLTTPDQSPPRVPQAAGARHDILVALYFIVRDGVSFKELGPDWHQQRNSAEHRTRRLDWSSSSKRSDTP